MTGQVEVSPMPGEEVITLTDPPEQDVDQLPIPDDEEDDA